jgi:hypothetical protein
VKRALMVFAVLFVAVFMSPFVLLIGATIGWVMALSLLLSGVSQAIKEMKS